MPFQFSHSRSGLLDTREILSSGEHRIREHIEYKYVEPVEEQALEIIIAAVKVPICREKFNSAQGLG